MRRDYSDSFLKDMAPPLADHYASLLDVCREAVREAADRMESLVTAAADVSVPPGASATGWELFPRPDHPAHLWTKPLRDYTNRSGKLLRPYLVCLCLEAYGKDPAEYRSLIGAAEVIHSSSLILDDVSDDSPLRRGAKTAHQQYGMRVAGAAASATLNLASELVWAERHRLELGRTERLLAELAWEHFVTGVGTAVDVVWAEGNDVQRTEERYLQQIVHRSTSYTYRLPLKVGAVCSGAPSADFDGLSEFGELVGLAFQLIDDILNVKPTDSHWGKVVAEDVTQGKRSLQVIVALERSDPAGRRRLAQILDSRTRDPVSYTHLTLPTILRV